MAAAAARLLGFRPALGLAVGIALALGACASPAPQVTARRSALVGGACATASDCGDVNQLCVASTCVCADGYFGNAGAASCTRCDSSCQTCSGPTADDCTSCGVGAQLAAAVGDACTTNADCALLSTANSNGGVCTAGACVLSACQAGYYVSGNSCVACTAVAGCTSAVTCTSGSDSQCTSCAGGSYLVDSTADSCATCTACAAGTYQVTDCTATTDRVCAACTAVTSCTSAVTCTSGGDSQCTSCASGTYLVDGTADTCASCAAACSPGTYESTACTGTSNRACTACPGITGCTSAVSCTSASTARCTTCVAGTYLVAGGSGAPDSCAACNCPSDGCHPGTCSAAGVCDVAANGTGCDDHNLCTTGDSCASGVCAGAAVVCPSDDCHPGVCNAATGSCNVSPDGTSCTGDGNPCTADRCTAGACSHPAGNAGTQCSGPACSAGVATLAATCTGVSTSCPAAATQICAPGLCSGTICGIGCSSDGNCAANAFCNGGTCATKLADRQACTADTQCQSGHCLDGACNVGVRLVLTPSTSPVPPRGSSTFTTTGGSGAGLNFAVSTNRSGAAIDAGGHYTAGQTGSVTDVVTVTDSFGNTATASIVVGPGVDLSPPAPQVAPRGALSFVASGGSGQPFVYTLRTNASGATLNSSSGAYRAGTTTRVIDVVAATDALGNVAVSNIMVGDGVTVSPQSPAVPPRGSLTLTAAGGSGTGFVFTLTTNASGSTLNASTGAYVAGPTPQTTDLVTVTDSLGNAGTTSISVGGGVAVQPASLSVPPRGSATFVASGGSGSAFTFTLLTNASGGSVNPATGAYVAGSTGSVTDVVKVSDGLGSSTTVSVTVGAGLTLTPSALSVAPLGQGTFAVSGGAGSGYTFALSSAPSGGSVDALTGAYLAGAVGGVVDVVTATDLLGNRITANVTVTAALAAVAPTLNVPPRGAGAISVAGGAPPYVFALTSNGSLGLVDPLTGSYTAGVKPDTTDVISVSDQNGATSSVVVSVGDGVSIAPASPVAAPRQTIPFGATGGSGTGYVYTLATNASGAVIDAATGAYTAGATGGVADVVTVTDSLGNTDDVTVSVGGKLVLNLSATTVAPRGSLNMTASGGSGTGYLFTLTSNFSGGTIQPTTGAYLAGFTGDVTDVVTVTDSLGNTATASIPVGHGLRVTIAVTRVAPGESFPLVVSGGSGSGYQFVLTSNQSMGTIDAAGVYQAGPLGDVNDVVTVTDTLGNMIGVTIAVGSGLTLTSSAATVPPRGTALFSPVGGSGGGFTFVVRSNGSGGTVNATTGAYVAGDVPNSMDVIEVTDAFGNRASESIAVGPGLTVTPAAPAVAPLGSLVFTATGGSGSGFQFAFVMNASGGTLGATTGVYTAGATTDVIDVVTVTDALGNTLTVNIAVGDALTLNPPSPAVAPRGHLQLVAAGGSGSGYAFALTTNASGGSVDPSTGVYTAGASGDVVDIVTATDSLGNSAYASIMVGDPLQLSPGSIDVAPLGAVTFATAGGSGSGYVFMLAENGSSGHVDARTGAYVAGTEGGTTDVVSVTDSLGNVATASIHVGGALHITAPAGPVPPRGPLALVVSGGAGGLTFSVSTNHSGASINPATGLYTAGPTGNVTDVVTAHDANGATATVTVAIGPGVQITPVPGGAHAGKPLTLTVIGGSGAGYTWTLVSAGSGGTIQAATGAYQPGPHAGTDTVQVVDSLGNTATIAIPVAAPAKQGGGGCTYAGPGAGTGFIPASLLLAASLLLRRRRRPV